MVKEFIGPRTHGPDFEWWWIGTAVKNWGSGEPFRHMLDRKQVNTSSMIDILNETNKRKAGWLVADASELNDQDWNKSIVSKNALNHLISCSSLDNTVTKFTGVATICDAMMVGNWTKIEGFERTRTMDLVDEGKPCVRVGYVREWRSMKIQRRKVI